MRTEIKHTWFYNQSPQEIWDYLTKAELIEKWLMPNDFELKLGHEFKFTTNPIPSLNLDGKFYCKILEIIPLKKLVYSWNGGLSKNNPTLETIVKWTIIARENGTELKLVHSGFKKDNASILTAMFDGWDKNIQKMLNQINSN
ncbi:hypothetical protein B4Q04_21215 [Zobellia sp. OII3]|uniref:SRPBCC family protein n=1 Tax=Zobellia sp. OII3 TaxID=2034520 RepID=UPI000B52CC5C|nr:SRPBCC domain-containing protein [Zobellia sp. OII3]OWW23364.1 hypothetical protein B4Q04_21215 [Zobellia sp. OII3]